MGWFDKKSWQLRRKIRDLQSELAVAEREGKYVVEQGLFFAELQEMGDATIMVLGTADHLDSEEEDIVRNFFDRNGFTVETLRLDRTHKTLAGVELIPPEELTRRVARILKEDGYRLVDDSDQERPSNLDKKIITLSSIIRAVAALFTAHVHHLIISTPIKMNMEGNRLLHWTPLIRECLMKKVPSEVVALCRDPFINAYNHYYVRFGNKAETEHLQHFTDEPSDEDILVQEKLAASEESTDFGGSESSATPPADEISAPWALSTAEGSTPVASSRNTEQNLFGSGTSSASTASADRKVEAAQALAKIYKGLIGASGERRVRNAEVVLEVLMQFFSARAICILSRLNPESPFKLQANSGKSLCVETGDDGTVICDTEIIQKAAGAGAITALAPDGNGHTNPKTLIVPIETDNRTETVLYIVEPKLYNTSEASADAIHLTQLAQVFREFPDLVLPGNFTEKS